MFSSVFSQPSAPSSSTQDAIYIPAYNAEKTIIDVLNRIYKTLGKDSIDILIVDNASTDRMVETVQSYIRENQITRIYVIQNKENLGYGGSQKVGYQWCIERNYRYIAMVHSDGQYAPEYLPALFKTLEQKQKEVNQVGMIFGSRIAGDPLKGGMPLHRFLGNKFLSFVQNMFLGLRLSEYHSGYRIYVTDVLKTLPYKNLSSDYHFDTEIIILLLHYHKEMAETAIPTKYGDEENYVNIWKYGTDVLATTISYWLHLHNIRRSKNWARILT